MQFQYDGYGMLSHQCAICCLLLVCFHRSLHSVQSLRKLSNPRQPCKDIRSSGRRYLGTAACAPGPLVCSSIWELEDENSWNPLTALCTQRAQTLHLSRLDYFQRTSTSEAVFAPMATTTEAMKPVASAQ